MWNGSPVPPPAGTTGNLWASLGLPPPASTPTTPVFTGFSVGSKKQEAAEPQRRIEGEDRRQAEHDGEGSQGMGGAEVPHGQRC